MKGFWQITNSYRPRINRKQNTAKSKLFAWSLSKPRLLCVLRTIANKERGFSTLYSFVPPHSETQATIFFLFNFRRKFYLEVFGIRSCPGGAVECTCLITEVAKLKGRPPLNSTIIPCKQEAPDPMSWLHGFLRCGHMTPCCEHDFHAWPWPV